MARYDLEDREGALRLAIPQQDWQQIAALLPGLPPFLTTDPPRTSPPEPDPSILEELSPALRTGLAITQDSLAHVELQSAIGHRGVALKIWIGTFAAVEIRRNLDLSQDTPRIEPGVEVSVLDVELVVDELTRYILNRPLSEDAVAFSMPEEILLPLTHALNEGRTDDVKRLLDSGGYDRVPPLLAALVSEVEGDSVIETTGPLSSQILRLLLTPAGWVETHRRDDAVIVSTPYDRASLASLLTADLAGHLSAAVSTHHEPGAK